jgi:hypothetical protein
MRILLLAMFAFCLLPTPGAFGSPSPTGDISVDSEGYGNTKEEALLQAKREAVEKGIGTVLVSQTEVKNFMLQKDVVITQTFGAVRRYDVQQEEQLPDAVWHIRIRAVVSLDSIRADLAALKILLESMDKPRMMVLIQEDGGNYAESAVVDYLRGKGFDLVDPAQTAALMSKGDQFIERAIQGDPVAAAKIGAENGAEYVLVGKVNKSQIANPMLQNSGMVSGQASLTAKVVNCSSGRIIASKSANGASPHISADVAQAKAAEKAAQKLMDAQLFEAIVASFQDRVNNGVSIEVTVRNVADYQAQKNLTKLLEGISGVTSVTRRGFDRGELKLSVLFRGQVDSFCDAVDGKAASDKSLAVTSVTGSSIVMNLK